MNRRPLVAAIVVAAVFTAVQTALPLFGVPGYEAAELQAILFAFLAGHLAIAFVGRRDDGEEPLHAAARSSAVSFALLAGVCAVMLASAMVRGERDLAWSFAWFLVLPVPTILLASAWGFLVAVIASSPRKRHIAYALIVIAHFAYEIMLIWKQPVTFSFNVLLGYFPGPVYDRAVYFTDAVFSSRAQAVLLAIFLTGFSLITGRRRRDRRSANVLPLQLAALSAIGFAALALTDFETGTEMRRGRIEKELGGKVIGRNIVLHHAEDLTARERRLLLLDAEFRFDQQARFLGRSDARPVHAFFYRGEREKKKLMGAGQTQYADIANHEMHMNYESPPIPVLKHEIVHVLSGPWGMSGLGFSKVLGITEGLAVASEIWRDEDAIPYWAAAMKAVGRLPDLAAISGPTGFWRLSGSRSYLAWGGFITWLIENYSMDHVRRVYGSADWDGIFGQDLPGLVAAWEKSLDELDVPPRLLRTAAYKYFRKSLFESKNARSVGRLTDDAERAARRGRYLLSGREYARAVDLSGGGSRYRDDLVDVLFAARRYDDAWNEAQKIVDMEGRDLGKEIGPGEVVRGDLAAAVRALATQAAVAWLRGDHLGARLLYQRVLDADVFWSLNRESAVALYALDHPEIEPDLRRYMVDPDARPAAEFLLHRAIEKMPDSGVLHYLLGRRLSVARLVDDAAAEFSLAIDLGLPTYDLRVKNFFEYGQLLYEGRRYPEAERIFMLRRPADLSPGHALEAEEWTDRCRFAAAFEAAHQDLFPEGLGDNP